MGDFVVETKGQCFLCLEKILQRYPPVKSKLESKPGSVSSSTYHSLRRLSRYLRINMRKVFSNEKDRAIPPGLLAKVERSSLKVELCEECVYLTEGLSELCWKLEKIEMEVVSKLELVQGKILLAEKTGRAQQFREDGYADSGFTGKCQIAEELRMETLEKCSLKLNPAIPRVKLQNLSLNQRNEEERRIKWSSSTTPFKLAGSKLLKSESSSVQYETGNNEYSDVEMETSFEPSPLSPRWSDAKVGSDQECEINPLKGSDPSNQSYMSDLKKEGGSHPESGNSSGSSSKTNRIGKSGLEVSQKKMKLTIDDYSVSIPAPIKEAGVAGSFRSTIDTKTGKHKCGSCSKEFASYSAVRKHYEAEHLKVRNKCIVCGEEFTQSVNYRVHYQNFHMHVKFKCTSCSKTFKHKSGLSKHQQSAHLGVRYKCNFCSKTFSEAGYRNVYMKTIHSSFD